MFPVAALVSLAVCAVENYRTRLFAVRYAALFGNFPPHSGLGHSDNVALYTMYIMYNPSQSAWKIKVLKIGFKEY